MAITGPATMEELEEAGYGYTGTGKICRCGTQILWFIRPPNEGEKRGKWVPFSALKDSRLVAHHKVCKRVEEFRRLKKEREKRAEEKRQRSLF